MVIKHEAFLSLHKKKMFTVIGVMVSGIVVGYLFRNWYYLQKVGKLISFTILLLLFLLGITVGTNKAIIDNLSVLGVQAFLISSAAVLGSAVCALLVYRFFFKERNEA